MKTSLELENEGYSWGVNQNSIMYPTHHHRQQTAIAMQDETTASAKALWQRWFSLYGAAMATNQKAGFDYRQHKTCGWPSQV